MEQVRFGLVGAGAIAASHVTGIHQTPGAKLAAVCVRRPEQVAEIEALYQVPCFVGLDTMIDSGLIDAVSIVTPSGAHLEAAIRAAHAGLHILVEKPMHIAVDGIDRMTQAAQAAGVKLGCAFQARFREVPRRVKAFIDAGALGEIFSGCAYHKGYRTQQYYDSASWRGTMELDGGGCLMNQGSHTVDLLLWNMGDVSALTAIAETRGRERIDVETIAFVLLEYSSGAKGIIESTTLAYPGQTPYIEIFGSRGSLAFDSKRLIRLDLVDPSSEEAQLASELKAFAAEGSPSQPSATRESAGTVVTFTDMGHGPVIADLVAAIKNDSEPLINGPEARRSVELITSAYSSARSAGRRIQLR